MRSDAALPAVHSQFGGSVAARVLHCPASVGLVEKVPAHLRKTSSYAERGTACHAAMVLLLGDNRASLESLVGKTFNDYTITRDDVENALRPAYAYAEALLEAWGRILPRTPRYLSDRRRRLRHRRPDRPHRPHDPRGRFQVRCRRARPGALS